MNLKTIVSSKSLKKYFEKITEKSKSQIVIIFLIFFVYSQLYLSSLHAQVIVQDSKGKDIFELYKAGTLTGSFAPSQLSMQINYNFIIGKPYYYYLNDTTNKTISVARAFSITGKVTGAGVNQGKPFSLNKELIRPSYRLELGYQRTLEVFNNIKLIDWFTYAAGGNIFGEIQNINLYDSVTKITKSLKPFVFGMHGHITAFHKSGVFAISLSQDIGKTYNQDNFLPYQNRAGTYIDQNVVSQAAFVGNIGVYKKVVSYRTRLSTPIFFNKYFNLIPYYVKSGYINDQSADIGGIALNFFNGNPRETNGIVGQGFGIGLDWVKNKGNWSSPNYFIYGSLNLELVRKVFKPEEKKGNVLLR